MRITVENGWRGPIDGIARTAALQLRGEVAIVLIPRDALLRTPRPDTLITSDDRTMRVLTVAAERGLVTLTCALEPSST